MSDKIEEKILDFQQVEVNITTNKSDEKIVLTKDLLYIPNIDTKRFMNFSTYPVITDSVELPYNAIYELDYLKKVEIFFVSTEMEKIITSEIEQEYILDENNTSEEFDEMRRKNLYYNVFLMIRLLFPSVYPFSNNVNKSMDLVTNGVLKTEGEEFYTKFSYLKINNSIETVINVTLLNDLLNHPKYFEFIKMMYTYLNWAANKYKTSEKKLKEIEKDFTRKFEKLEDNQQAINEEIEVRERGIKKMTETRRSRGTTRAIEDEYQLQVLQDLKSIIRNNDVPINDKWYIVKILKKKYPSWATLANTNIKDETILLMKKIGNNKYLHNWTTENVTFEIDKNNVIREDLIDWPKCSVYINIIDHDKWGTNLNLVKYLSKEVQDNRHEKSTLKGRVNKIKNKIVFTIDNTEKLIQVKTQPVREVLVTYKEYFISNFETLNNTKSDQITFELDEKGVPTGKIIFQSMDEFRKSASFENFELIEQNEREELFDKIKSLISAYEQYEKVSGGYRLTNEVLSNFINDAKSKIKNINLFNRFNEEYIKCNSDTKKIIECVKLYVNDASSWDKEFEIFQQTITKYKQYMSDVYKSNNTKLQDLIDDYGNNETKGENDGLLNQVIIRLYEKYILNKNTRLSESLPKIDSKIKDLLDVNIVNTNMGDISKPQYQIHVFMDFMGGEVNRTNLSGLKCSFEDEDLVQRLYSIFDPNPQIWKSKSMPYIQAPPPKKDEQSAKENAKLLQQEQMTAPAAGGRKTKKYSNNNNKTRRR